VRLRRLIIWAVGAIVAVLALSWVGVYVYINFIKADPPPPLSFDSLDAATTTSANAASSSSCSPLTIESGRAVFTVNVADGAVVSLSGDTVSGEVSVCDGVVSTGTIDVDVVSAQAATDAETAAALEALQADEFPVVSLTVTEPGKALALVAGEERTVTAQVQLDGSAATVSADLAA
jgi:hypothetical protein